MYVAEVAPLAPAAPVVAVAFAGLVLVIVSIGLSKIVANIVRALLGAPAGVLGHIPWVGGKLSAPVRAVENRALRVVTDAAAACQSIGTRFLLGAAYQVEHLANSIWASLVDYGLAIRGLENKTWSWIQHATVHPGTVVRTVVRVVRVTVPAHVAHVVTKPLAYIEREIAALRQRVAHIVAEVVPGAIAWPRARLRADERSLAKAWRWLRRHETALGGLGALGLVGVALRRLGLGWLQCRNVKTLGKRVCGMDGSLLESLLLDLVAILSVISVVEFAREVQAFEGITEDALRTFVREFHQVTSA